MVLKHAADALLYELEDTCTGLARQYRAVTDASRAMGASLGASSLDATKHTAICWQLEQVIAQTSTDQNSHNRGPGEGNPLPVSESCTTVMQLPKRRGAC